MPGTNKAVTWVSSQGGANRSGRRLGDFVPGGIEALVDLAVVDKVAVFPCEYDVGDEVADIVATADREDDLLALGVCGNITSDTGDQAARTDVSASVNNKREGC